VPDTTTIELGHPQVGAVAPPLGLSFLYSFHRVFQVNGHNNIILFTICVIQIVSKPLFDKLIYFLLKVLKLQLGKNIDGEN